MAGTDRRSSGPEETRAIGRALAGRLPPGTTLLLEGGLGAGKTQLVKGLAEGLGLDPDEVTSPTFTIVQVHRGRSGEALLVHADLYRIGDPSELAELGLPELSATARLTAVEWGERLGTAGPPGTVRVAISDLGGDLRRIVVEA